MTHMGQELHTGNVNDSILVFKMLYILMIYKFYWIISKRVAEIEDSHPRLIRSWRKGVRDSSDI
jgi:cytochrome bd-type quinol oxidase subunit 1